MFLPEIFLSINFADAIARQFSRSTLRHAFQIAGFIGWIIFFEIASGAIPIASSDSIGFDPFERYGIIGTLLLYLLRVISLLALPQVICSMLGLLMFNGFKERVKLRKVPALPPTICFRVVTRGDYPDLVQQNVEANIKICQDAGLKNFTFEVVTDKEISLPKRPIIREITVPTDYVTKTGAKFKARALQYCLEDGVNVLKDEDWIVHLDEETLLSTNSVFGILNFCTNGKHQFGQGVIIYANDEIVNWITTLSDSFRVADDMGKLRFQLSVLHKPIFGWKGSFVVTQLGAEKKVSFDHGLKGSIAEDCYFSMVAFRDGYTFDFIEGEMYEKSPFTCWDFLQQRRRWVQGIYLTVHSAEIPFKHKFFLTLSLYSWLTMPLTTLQAVLCPLFPLPKFLPLDILVAYIGAVPIYMYIVGVKKSFLSKYRDNYWRLILYSIGALITMPFNIIIENVAVLMGVFGRKDGFYVVNKDSKHLK